MERKKVIIIFVILILLSLVLGLLVGSPHGEGEDIKTAMRDAVIHDVNQMQLPGGLHVNPAVIGGFVITAIVLLAAVFIRIFIIPKFTIVPGKFQLILEEGVSLFQNMAKTNSPERHTFLSVYIFCAACYIFFGTLFELIGFQWLSVEGHSITLPAPLSDINAAIAMGFLSYLVILSGGILANGVKGIGRTLKEFSLPISMSFRLFGALLSGLLVTHLVYHYLHLSFGLPVIVGVLFTLLHAVIQSYVLTMLTSTFYGEVTEKHEKES